MARHTPSPNPVDHTNWLIIANQIWKLYVALLGFAASFLCFVAAGIVFMKGGQLLGTMVGVGMILGVVTFLWLLKTLRCPSCERPLVWTMIRTQSHMSWLIDLVNLQECPICHSNLLNAASQNQRRVKNFP